jgi:Flp pilus assembly protein TadD
MKTKMMLALLAATLATPLAAAPSPDYAAAVRSQEAAARLQPNDGGTAIELAAAYLRAGRVADAHNSYRRALTLDNQMLETPTGDAIWSHQVARRALGSDVNLSLR